MRHTNAPTIVFVFGAGIEGFGKHAQLDWESKSALYKAHEVAKSHNNAPIIALPGHSKKYRVHFGKLFHDAIKALTGYYPPVERKDCATDFNSIGEVHAFWRWIDSLYNRCESDLQTVEVVARGVHSYRCAFLTRALRPARYHHVRIHRHRADSYEEGLLKHELKKGWPQAITYVCLHKPFPKLARKIGKQTATF